MPDRTPTPCRRGGCSQLVRDGSGFCEKHKQLKGWGSWQAQHGNERQRGYDSAWRKLRKQILIRDKYLCQECKRQGRLQQGSQVDHIKPKAQGGTDGHGNLQTLCVSCHATKTASESRGRGESKT